MRKLPQPTAQITAVPAVTPFVAPEELARRVGRASLLRLGANESAWGPSPQAIAAMQAAAERTSWYGDPESLDLRAALAVRHGCSEDNLVVGSGIDDLMSLLVRTFCAPGDIAVATRGTYPTWGYHVAGHGARLVTAEPAPGAAIDVDALIASAAAAAPKVVYVANPDNPSGAFVSASELARLRAGLADDVLLVIDEAYADFVAADLLPPAVLDPRTIRLRTFSKAYGLAGARVGYAIAAQAVIATFKKIRQHFGVNRTAQIGALAALGDPAYVGRIIAEVARGRDEYAALGRQLGCRTLPSVTNFVCFEVGTRSMAEAMVDDLLECGVFVRKPSAPPIDGFIRVTVGTPPERTAFAQIFSEALACAREKAAV
ncbi:MAG: aminotransferase class I/II-fold pyridoxal phosphate-dependent enzyme [Candidatus Velthaea sp.]|jgi:histidinol-phosphate aminotransferase